MNPYPRVAVVFGVTWALAYPLARFDGVTGDAGFLLAVSYGGFLPMAATLGASALGWFDEKESQ